jgi:hypothetical protein
MKFKRKSLNTRFLIRMLPAERPLPTTFPTSGDGIEGIPCFTPLLNDAFDLIASDRSRTTETRVMANILRKEGGSWGTGLMDYPVAPNQERDIALVLGSGPCLLCGEEALAEDRVVTPDLKWHLSCIHAAYMLDAVRFGNPQAKRWAAGLASQYAEKFGSL